MQNTFSFTRDAINTARSRKPNKGMTPNGMVACRLSSAKAHIAYAEMVGANAQTLASINQAIIDLQLAKIQLTRIA